MVPSAWAITATAHRVDELQRVELASSNWSPCPANLGRVSIRQHETRLLLARIPAPKVQVIRMLTTGQPATELTGGLRPGILTQPRAPAGLLDRCPPTP